MFNWVSFYLWLRFDGRYLNSFMNDLYCCHQCFEYSQRFWITRLLTLDFKMSIKTDLIRISSNQDDMQHNNKPHFCANCLPHSAASFASRSSPSRIDSIAAAEQSFHRWCPLVVSHGALPSPLFAPRTGKWVKSYKLMDMIVKMLHWFV